MSEPLVKTQAAFGIDSGFPHARATLKNPPRNVGRFTRASDLRL